MRIIVFGANGRTGIHVVQQALTAGMRVSAFVRDRDKLKLSSPNLEIIVGQVTDFEAVKTAIAGHDAVVSCLGGPGTKPSTIITEMTQTIVAAMQATGVKRIVQMASAGVHGELTGAVGLLVAVMLKNPLRDHHGAFEVLSKSGLNYTLARPMSLADGPKTGIYREAENGIPAKARNIARADVADFLLKALNNEAYSYKSIGLGY